MADKKDKSRKIAIASPEEVEDFAADPSSETPAAPGEPTVDWKDKFLRAKAELQNVQRRAAEEQRSAVRYANVDLLRTLLDVVDDFERTLTAAGDDNAPAALRSGVQLVHDKLMKVLADHHVQVIEALHRPFDPQLHEALMQQPSADHPPDTVIQEVQKGYHCHDRVLRPTRVIVSRPPDHDPPPQVDTEA